MPRETSEDGKSKESSDDGLITFGEDEDPEEAEDSEAVTELLVEEVDLKDMIENAIQEFIDEELDIGGQLVDAIMERIGTSH